MYTNSVLKIEPVSSGVEKEGITQILQKMKHREKAESGYRYSYKLQICLTSI